MNKQKIQASLFASGLMAMTIAALALFGAGSPAQARTAGRMPQVADTPTVPPTPRPAATVVAGVTPPAPPNPITYGDPYVLKTVNMAQVKPGETIEFVLVVGNHGTADAVNVQVRDTLADHLDVVAVTTSKGTVTVTGRNILVDIGTVGVKEIVTIKITARGNSSMKAGSCGNLAVLNTTSGGDRTDNNSSGVNYVCGEVVIPETGGTTDTAQNSSLAWLLLTAGLLLLGGSRWAGQNEKA